jgi:uncharacterized membrane protein YkoI
MFGSKEESMNEKLKRGLLAGGVVAAIAGGGAAIAGASGGGHHPAAQPATQAADESASDNGAADEQTGRDDGEGHPVTGSKLRQASAIAIQAAGGGGRVTGSEKHDEEGYYEIEVTRPDGSQVDVHLDKALNVLDASADG